MTNRLVGLIYLRDSLRSRLRLKVHPGETKKTAVHRLHISGMDNHAREWVAPTRLCREQWPQIYENRGLSGCLGHFECLCHRLGSSRRFLDRNSMCTENTNTLCWDNMYISLTYILDQISYFMFIRIRRSFIAEKFSHYEEFAMVTKQQLH